MSEKLEIFENLRLKGHRITSQREQILEIFMDLPDGEHLSAEDLQKILLENDIKISLATLYRTLKFLSQNGLLRELDFGEDHKHYELILNNQFHHHLICNKCGITTEFENEELINLAKSYITQKNNFEVHDYQFKIFGLCKNCKPKKHNLAKYFS